MTQALRQQIEMLQLSTVELAELIQEELEANPVLDLEEDGDFSRAEAEGDTVSGDVSRELSHDDHEADSPVPDLPDDLRYNEYSGDDDRKREFIESVVTQSETLAEHLLDQARMLRLSPKMFSVVERVITSLDENGFLSADGAKALAETDDEISLIEEARAIIQTLEPIGCGATGVQNSLLSQARILYPDDGLLFDMIDKHFEQLSSLMYEKIAKAMNVAIGEITSASRLIRSLNPYPGRGFAHTQTKYIVPDIEVKLVGGEILIHFNDEWVPRLRISDEYLSMASQKDADKKVKEYVREKIAAAKQLMKNITGRRDTIEKVVRTMMTHQIEFLEKGPGHLKPLTCAQVAEIVQCHESTVSRVSSGKYLQCSWGTFEIKSFFVSKLGTEENDKSSDEALLRIGKIVAEEDPKSPLSDDAIAEILTKEGVTVARRTVSKYRDILNIPSSSKRKRLHILKSEGGAL
jgi:RNA polymerase sigma-54 factor